MRHRIRIQPYISPEVHQKVRAYAAARTLTESAVTEAALSEYCERDQIESSLVERRLDAVVHAIAQVQHDVNVVAQALAVFARYSFSDAPIPTPDPLCQHE